MPTQTVITKFIYLRCSEVQVTSLAHSLDRGQARASLSRWDSHTRHHIWRHRHHIHFRSYRRRLGSVPHRPSFYIRLCLHHCRGSCFLELKEATYCRTLYDGSRIHSHLSRSEGGSLAARPSIRFRFSTRRRDRSIW